jgi:hypothetical protein
MTQTREKILETLLSQYKEEIEEILIESEHVYRSTIDYELFHQKVNELINCAKGDGLEEKMIWDLLQTRIPSYVNYVNALGMRKKAA